MMRVVITLASETQTLTQNNNETDEAFRERVDLVIGLLQQKPGKPKARAAEPAALAVIRKAIRSKR